MNPGFYKVENAMLLYSPTTVESAEYYLTAERPGEHEYPIDGWCWFDTEAQAREALHFADENESS